MNKVTSAERLGLIVLLLIIIALVAWSIYDKENPAEVNIPTDTVLIQSSEAPVHLKDTLTRKKKSHKKKGRKKGAKKKAPKNYDSRSIEEDEL